MLHCAAAAGSKDMVEFLFNQLGIGSKSLPLIAENGFTVLDAAVKYGNTEVVEFICDKLEIELASFAKGKRTPLHLAAAYGHAGTVELLIRKGAPLAAQDENGITPLFLAARENHPEVIKLLGKRGNPEHQVETRDLLAKNFGNIVFFLTDKVTMTPLHCAAWNGHLEAARALFTHCGASPHTASNCGWARPAFCCKSRP